MFSFYLFFKCLGMFGIVWERSGQCILLAQRGGKTQLAIVMTVFAAHKKKQKPFPRSLPLQAVHCFRAVHLEVSEEPEGWGLTGIYGDNRGPGIKVLS